MTQTCPPCMNIRIVPALRLLDVRLSGLLTCDDVKALMVLAGAAVERIGCAPDQHRSLYDIGACKIQSQVVVAALREGLGQANRAHRLAIVAGASLMRMQLRRIVAADWNAAVFDERAGAMAWLVDQRGEAAARPVLAAP